MYVEMIIIKNQEIFKCFLYGHVPNFGVIRILLLLKMYILFSKDGITTRGVESNRCIDALRCGQFCIDAVIDHNRL